MPFELKNCSDLSPGDPIECKEIPESFFPEDQNVQFYANGNIKIRWGNSVFIGPIKTFDRTTGRISAKNQQGFHVELTFPPLSIPALWDFLEPEFRETLITMK